MSHNLLSGWHLRRIRCVRHSRHRGEVRSAASHQGRRWESSACPPAAGCRRIGCAGELRQTCSRGQGVGWPASPIGTGHALERFSGSIPAWGRSRFGLEKARGDIFAERSFQISPIHRHFALRCSRRSGMDGAAAPGGRRKTFAPAAACIRGRAPFARFAHASISFVEPSPPSFGGIRSRDHGSTHGHLLRRIDSAPPFADDVGRGGGLLVLLPVMYVGSFGAVVWLYGRGWIPNPRRSGSEWCSFRWAGSWNSRPALEPAFDAYIEWLDPVPKCGFKTLCRTEPHFFPVENPPPATGYETASRRVSAGFVQEPHGSTHGPSSDESTPRRHSLTMWGAAGGDCWCCCRRCTSGRSGVLWLVLGWMSESTAEWVGVMFIPLGWLGHSRRFSKPRSSRTWMVEP